MSLKRLGWGENSGNEHLISSTRTVLCPKPIAVAKNGKTLHRGTIKLNSWRCPSMSSSPDPLQMIERGIADVNW